LLVLGKDRDVMLAYVGLQL